MPGAPARSSSELTSASNCTDYQARRLRARWEREKRARAEKPAPATRRRRGGPGNAPPAIEAKFKAVCPYASQFMVFGDERNYCVALVTLDPDALPPGLR